MRGISALLALLLSATVFAADVTLDSARAEFLAMRSDEAQRQFTLLQAQTPNDPAVLFYLGRLQLRQNHRKAAVELLRRAVELQPDNVEYRIVVSAAIGAYIDDVPFYRKLGLAQEIHKHLEDALRVDPRSVDVRDGLVRFYLAAPGIIGGGRDKAVAEAARLMALDRSEGHIDNGVIAIHDKRYADAEREFRAAIQAAPKRAAPRYELGRLQQMQKQFDAAFASFEDVMQLLPRETAAYYHYANTAALANQRVDSGLEKVKVFLDRGPVTDEDPTPVMGYRILGRLSALSSKNDAARSAYQTALKMDPANAETVAALKKLD
ncbi:MAG: tetratricopeptide repeat protein [Pseudomonadota bacterium]